VSDLVTHAKMQHWKLNDPALRASPISVSARSYIPLLSACNARFDYLMVPRSRSLLTPSVRIDAVIGA